jgi:hypothetical protein
MYAKEWCLISADLLKTALSITTVEMGFQKGPGGERKRGPPGVTEFPERRGRPGGYGVLSDGLL